MDSRTAWSIECREAVQTVAASAAVLVAFTGTETDRSCLAGTDSNDGDRVRDAEPSWAADPVRDLADECLDALAEVARLEARTAALKVRLAADYAQATRSLIPPGAFPQKRTMQEMSLIAELACVLTVSERTSRELVNFSV